MGWHEWKETGRMPDPDELMKRIKIRWRDDLYLYDRQIEIARPKSDGNEQH